MGKEGESGACGNATKGAATGVEKEFVGGVEKEGGVVLWTNSATRCGTMGAGVARPRSCRHIFEVPKMWQREMLCGR